MHLIAFVAAITSRLMQMPRGIREVACQYCACTTGSHEESAISFVSDVTTHCSEGQASTRNMPALKVENTCVP